ncbi:MAG: hypothetical protein M1828_001122 [Chrysothrix sp. TS-e1954]|nr:MAG: hypothetical protein M1828_001122 [Chrysothrix sp. TS-e1954]
MSLLLTSRAHSNIFFTSSLKNDTRIFRKATELHDQVVADLLDFIPEADFLTECLFQPLPTVLGQVATQHGGGNMLNLSAQKADGVIFIAIVMVKTAAQERFAYPRTKAWHDGVCQYARTIDNGVLDWVYMNYADQSQDPLGSYGPANVKKLRDVAAEYDPQQVFQKLCPGGFKISQTKVGME